MLIFYLYVLSLFQIWDFSKKRMSFLYESGPLGVTAIRFIFERCVNDRVQSLLCIDSQLKLFSRTISYFANLEVQNLNKVFVYITDLVSDT